MTASSAGTGTYVGFGFGAIQAGLFLYEAYRSGAFGRLVVAEVMPDVVAAVRAGGGYFNVNIAHFEGVEQAHVGPIAIEDPAQESDRLRLIAAVAEAHEIGTAVPSVAFYASDSPGSLHRVLAQGLRQKAAAGGPPGVIYTAENHNHAAELLEQAVLNEIPAAERDAVRARVRFLNTVIGKMSGIVTDPDEIESQKLARITAVDRRAFLVERFNRILISQIRFDERSAGASFRRGITVFEEKPDLLPFEEAKLYGHNATHALAAYIGAVRGVQRVTDLRSEPGALTFLRHAFIEESGAALIRKYAGVDPLFTPEGYAAYADDLLHRMVNPYLRDTVERVGRDPMRKLGWDDRLVGTLRLALRQGVKPHRYGLGTAAAAATLNRPVLDSRAALEASLSPLWRDASLRPDERQAVLDIIESGRRWLSRWIESGFANLETVQPA